jgi:hypothetical protein
MCRSGLGRCPRSGTAPVARWCWRLARLCRRRAFRPFLGRLTGGNGYPKELVQYGICRLTSDRCSIARHGYGAMAVTLQALDLPRLEIDQHEGGVRRAENLHLGKVVS